jgi:hypothetical protein
MDNTIKKRPTPKKKKAEIWSDEGKTKAMVSLFRLLIFLA